MMSSIGMDYKKKIDLTLTVAVAKSFFGVGKLKLSRFVLHCCTYLIQIPITRKTLNLKIDILESRKFITIFIDF